jgi:hypothetical protein
MGGIVEKFSGGVKDGKDQIVSRYKKVSVEKKKNNLTRVQPRKSEDVNPRKFQIILDDYINNSRPLCESFVSSLYSKFNNKFNEREVLSLVDITLCVYLLSKLDSSTDQLYIEILQNRLQPYLTDECFNNFLLKANYVKGVEDFEVETVVVDSESLKSPKKIKK